MSAAKARKARTTAAPKPAAAMSNQEAARRVALYRAPGFLDVKRAQAATWLLRQMDGQMGFDRNDPAEMELEDLCRSICHDAIDDSLTKAGAKITAAVKESADKAAVS